MTWIILLILKGLIICVMLNFLYHVIQNRKKDPTLSFSVDFISVIELATVCAITIACLLSSLSSGSIFISVIAFLDLIVLYFEGKRVVLIGKKAVQLREELVLIKDIERIETSLWTLHVHTKDKTIKVMNPLVTSWKFQENVYNKLNVKVKGSRL